MSIKNVTTPKPTTSTVQQDTPVDQTPPVGEPLTTTETDDAKLKEGQQFLQGNDKPQTLQETSKDLLRNVGPIKKAPGTDKTNLDASFQPKTVQELSKGILQDKPRGRIKADTFQTSQQKPDFRAQLETESLQKNLSLKGLDKDATTTSTTPVSPKDFLAMTDQQRKSVSVDQLRWSDGDLKNVDEKDRLKLLTYSAQLTQDSQEQLMVKGEQDSKLVKNVDPLDARTFSQMTPQQIQDGVKNADLTARLTTVKTADLEKLTDEERAAFKTQGDFTRQEFARTFGEMDLKDISKGVQSGNLLASVSLIEKGDLEKLTPESQQKFQDKVVEARNMFQAKLEQEQQVARLKDRKEDNSPYATSWKNSRVETWRDVLESTDHAPDGSEFSSKVKDQDRATRWRTYLENKIPKDASPEDVGKVVTSELGKKHDLSELSVKGRESLEKRLKGEDKDETPMWKKALNFTATSVAFSLFDYVAFNMWPRKDMKYDKDITDNTGKVLHKEGDVVRDETGRIREGDVKGSYRVVQGVVQGALTLHLLNTCGPNTAAAFTHNWLRFGDDYLFYAEGLLAKKMGFLDGLDKKPWDQQHAWDGEAGFNYFNKQPDGTYQDASWTTWVLRDGSHGFDRNNPNDTMNSQELIENFTKGSFLTYRLLSQKDKPVDWQKMPAALRWMGEVKLGN